MEPRIRNIVERWYIREPALLMIFFSHELEENIKMSCPFRCGKGVIEYNPQIVESLDDEQLESCLKAEAIRIILKHPYERQPDGCKRKSMALGSDLVLADNYDFDNIGLYKPSLFNLPENESYEWYSLRIEAIFSGKEIALPPQPPIAEIPKTVPPDLVPEHDVVNVSSLPPEAEPELGDDDFYVLKLADGSEMRIPKGDIPAQATDVQNGQPVQSQESNVVSPDIPKEYRRFDSDQTKSELSELWKEDSMFCCTIDSIIDDIQSSGTGWGSLAGEMESRIIANTKAKIDYRKTLSGFRASVLSSKRHLSRMRPNRRSGFDNMGSIRRFDTNLLIAVDVSGSVSDELLAHFYSVVGRIFRYGIEHIDVVQFDCDLGDIESFDRAKKRIDIVGRGGTSFQPVFDYVAKHAEYDGLIILTDGCAPEPRKPKNMKAKVVWVCDNRQNYDTHRHWMKHTGRCCTIII